MDIQQQIDIINNRVNGVYQMMSFIDEYERYKDTIELTTEYHEYFHTMYSYIYRYIILELCRIDEGTEKDCIAISTLTNKVIRCFDSIVPKENIDLYGHENCNITVDEMKRKKRAIWTEEIMDIKELVFDIRNKKGLAHGQEEVYDTTISLGKLKKLLNAYAETVQMIDERVNNSHFAFGNGIFHYNSLSELIPHIRIESESMEV